MPTPLTPTAANVIPSSQVTWLTDGNNNPLLCAVAVTAGQMAYKLADNTYGIADCMGADPVCKPVGMFANTTAAAGQRCDIIKKDPRLKIAASGLVVGKVYVLGLTGAINPTVDVATGWKVSKVGVVYSATEIIFDIDEEPSPAAP